MSKPARGKHFKSCSREVVSITPSLPHNIPLSKSHGRRLSRLCALPGTPHVLHRRIALVIPPLLLLLQPGHKWLMTPRLHHLLVQRPRLMSRVHGILGRRRKMNLRDVRVWIRVAVFNVLC